MNPQTFALLLPPDEISFEFIRSSGPGGQNVNKVATAVQLRFDIRNSPSLTDEVKARLIHLAGKKMTSEGVLLILARRYRSQERNRDDALARLSNLLQRAYERPRTRRPTQPGPASRQKRIAAKKHRGGVKKLRQPVSNDEH